MNEWCRGLEDTFDTDEEFCLQIRYERHEPISFEVLPVLSI